MASLSANCNRIANTLANKLKISLISFYPSWILKKPVIEEMPCQSTSISFLDILVTTKPTT